MSLKTYNVSFSVKPRRSNLFQIQIVRAKNIKDSKDHFGEKGRKGRKKNTNLGSSASLKTCITLVFLLNGTVQIYFKYKFFAQKILDSKLGKLRNSLSKYRLRNENRTI